MNRRPIAALACIGLLTIGIHSVALAQNAPKKKPPVPSGNVTFYTVELPITVFGDENRAVSCNEGDVVVSGGYDISPATFPYEVFVWSSYPAVDPNDPTGSWRHWVFRVTNASATNFPSATLYARCAHTE